MCIICYKPAGVGIPSLERLKVCFNYNNDGAGVMFPCTDGVKIVKGMMDWDSFEKTYKKMASMPKSTPMVFHFRIGTHGKVHDPTMTHPFPVTYDIDAMEVKTCVTETGVAHNGIISTVNFGFGGSDTMDFIAGVLYPLLSDYDSITDPTVDIMLQNFLGKWNKLAVMYKGGKVELFGTFVDGDDGCKYSNSTYIPYTYVNKKYDDDTYFGKGQGSATQFNCTKFSRCFNACYKCSKCVEFNMFADYDDDISPRD